MKEETRKEYKDMKEVSYTVTLAHFSWLGFPGPLETRMIEMGVLSGTPYDHVMELPRFVTVPPQGTLSHLLAPGPDYSVPFVDQKHPDFLLVCV